MPAGAQRGQPRQQRSVQPSLQPHNQAQATHAPTRAIAASLGDAEGAIPDNFEVSGMALAALLERWRERFGQPQSETFTQS